MHGVKNLPPSLAVHHYKTPALVAVVPAALSVAGRPFAVGPGTGWVLCGVDAVIEAVVFAVAHMGRLRGEARLSVHAGARGRRLAAHIRLPSPATLITNTIRSEPHVRIRRI